MAEPNTHFEPIPVITLSNGLKVGNFSSPHPFTFADGSILPSCSLLRATQLSASIQEEWVDKPRDRHEAMRTITMDITLDSLVMKEITFLHNNLPADSIVIVPLMMIQGLRNQGWSNDDLMDSPFRTIRKAEGRASQVCCIDKFCI